MDADRQRVVTVFGSSQPREGEADYAQAYELGKRLALAGYTLCNGGTGGTMRAAAQGAREAGGRTIGVTMDIYIPDPPNSWLDEEVRGGDLFTRLQRLILPASGFICLRSACGLPRVSPRPAGEHVMSLIPPPVHASGRSMHWRRS
jgi:uncharacterized protein (TIGR00725 family)